MSKQPSITGYAGVNVYVGLRVVVKCLRSVHPNIASVTHDPSS